MVEYGSKNCIESILEHREIGKNVRPGTNDVQRLENLCRERLLYITNGGVEDTINKKILYRLQKEISYIRENGFAHVYIYAYDLICQNSRIHSFFSLRGCGASAVVNYLLGISHVNPLDSRVPLYSEFFMGKRGDKRPHIDLCVDKESWDIMLESAKKIEKDNEVYYVREYDELPRHFSIYYRKETASFFYNPEDEGNEILDITENTACTLNARLYEKTGYYPSEDDIKAEKFIQYIIKMLVNVEIMNIECNLGEETGAYIELTRPVSRKLIRKLHPQNYADLVKIVGLNHSIKGTWANNLISDKKNDLKDIIATREDVYERLCAYRIRKADALAITEEIRKGRFQIDEVREKCRIIMSDYELPTVFIKSCEEICYLSSRAQATEYLQSDLRNFYYEIYYPELFMQVYRELSQ